MQKRIFSLKVLQERYEREEREKDKEWRKLRNRISSVKTDDEILNLRDDINSFFESDASEEDKEKLSQYTESLAMLVIAAQRRRAGGK